MDLPSTLCDNPLIISYVFIVIIFIAIFLMSNNTATSNIKQYRLEILIATLVSGFTLLLFCGAGLPSSETEGFIPITNRATLSPAGLVPGPANIGGDVNVDVDDTEFSPYGNISLRGDIDSMKQRIIGLDIPDSDEIDNSDVVAQVVERGNTVFQPNGVGVSPTSNALMSNFSLAGPSGIVYMDQPTSYDIPQANKNSIDELVARAGQARGSRAQQAIDGYVRSTRNLYDKYFRNELDYNANREWWGNTGDEMETDFTPYDWAL